MNYELNEQEANLIIQGLAELPAKLSMNLIGKIQAQWQAEKKKQYDEDQKTLAEKKEKKGE